MDTTAAFGFRDLIGHIVGDVVKAVCGRAGETKQEQFVRSQAATYTIMGFLPRDAIEAILAGRCVMFHELTTAGARDLLRGEVDGMRRASRGSIVAMDRAFANNLTRLERYQARPADGRRDEPDVRTDTSGEVVAARQTPEQAVPARVAPVLAASMRPAPTHNAVPRVGTPLAASGAAQSKSELEEAVSMRPESTQEAPAGSPRPELDALPPHLREAMAGYYPSPDTVASCRTNLDAMEALAAGDAVRFAQALGVETPSEDFLTAASNPGSPFAPKSRGPEAGSSKRGESE